MLKRYRKILSIICVSLSFMTFAGCTPSHTVETKVKTKDKSQQELKLDKNFEDILLTYNEEGIKKLKNTYTDKNMMELALKNIGNTAQDVIVKTTKNETLNLKDMKGKKILLNIVQPDCEFCKQEAKVLAADKNNDYILINIFEKAQDSDITQYYKDLKIEQPQYVVNDNEKKLITRFSLTQTPTIIYVDELGKISLVSADIPDDTQFKNYLKQAFAQKKIYNMKAQTK